MISVAEAQAAILALATRLPAETVPLRAAAGRWLAQPVTAAGAQPPFDSSAMDGYALPEAAVAGARYRVVGQSAAGHGYAGTLAPGQAVRIFTGAPVPPGTVAVLIQEDAIRDGDTIEVGPGSDGSTNIRPRGQDIGPDFVLPPRRLRPADLALLAAMDCGTVPVVRRPVLALIATGDELTPPGEARGPDQIPASNTYALAALAEAEGATVRILPIARDTEAALQSAFALAEGADMIVTTGGASVGDHDLVAGAAVGRGMDLAFHKVAMRPGKPLMAGRMGTAAMIGLPGNPVSAIVCGMIFMLPLIRAMQGDPDPLPRLRRARLTADQPANGPRTHFTRARLDDAGDGLPGIAPESRQDSALLSVLAGAAALMVRPAGQGALAAGDLVDYLPL